MARTILDRIGSVDAYATVAVIGSTEAEARKWYNLLSEDLSELHRPGLLSRRDDLTRRFEVHFTEVSEVKGLEFDIVIVPDFSCFALDDEIGRNQAYVAISRAKYALLLGCDKGRVYDAGLSALVRHGLVQLVGIAVQ